MSNDFNDFFSSHAADNGKGTFKVNMSDFTKLMEQHGLPKSVQEQLNAFQTKYNDAAAKFLVGKAKEDGVKKGDKLSVVTAVHGGQDSITLHTWGSFANPQDRTQISEKFGRVVIGAKRHRFISKDVLAQCEQAMKDQLGK